MDSGINSFEEKLIELEARMKKIERDYEFWMEKIGNDFAEIHARLDSIEKILKERLPDPAEERVQPDTNSR